MWPRRFLAVPTSALLTDPATGQTSPKGYSQQELREMAATVPAIYDRLGAGATAQDLVDLRQSPDPKDRQLAATYSQLFQDSPSSHPLRASYDGADLVVDNGNHRVNAARDIGVPVLPVWVSAPTEAELARVEDACNRRIDREGARAYAEAHQAHEHSLSWTPTQTADFAASPERRQHETPEIRRWSSAERTGSERSFERER